MAKKNLNKMRRQLRNQDYTLLRSLNNAYQPGALVEESSEGHITLMGMIASAMTEGSFPAIQGPQSVVLEAFEGQYDLDVDAAAEWVQADLKVNGEVKNKVNVRGSFTDAQFWWVDLASLSMQVAQQVDGVNGQTLKNFLMHQNYRLVNHVLKARLSFHFEKEGGGSVTVEGAIPNTPISAEANPKFKWKNQATIESTEPIIVAVKLADWHNGRGMFVADH